MSITSDKEYNHNCHHARLQLCRWLLIAGDRTCHSSWWDDAGSRFPCTKGPTGTQLPRSGCTQMRIYNWLMCFKLSNCSNIWLNMERVPCRLNSTTYLSAVLSKRNSEF